MSADARRVPLKMRQPVRLIRLFPLDTACREVNDAVRHWRGATHDTALVARARSIGCRHFLFSAFSRRGGLPVLGGGDDGDRVAVLVAFSPLSCRIRVARAAVAAASILCLAIALIARASAAGTPDSTASSADACVDVRTGTPFEFHARHLLSSGQIDSAWTPGASQRGWKRSPTRVRARPNCATTRPTG